jgi:hypothetical protein
MKDFAKAQRQLELKAQCDEWIKDNPEAYARFVELGLERVRLGLPFAIASLTEVIRWDGAIRFKKKDFKISNSIRRYIALQMCQDHPEIEPFITTKGGEVETPSALVGHLRYELKEDPTSTDDLFAFMESRGR